MAAKGRPGRSASRAATVALPRRSRAWRKRVLPLLARVAPSRRSLALGCGILVVAVGGYAIARTTSIFAIHRIEVRGGSSQVEAEVRQALAPFVGRSLVGLDGGAVLRRVDALPTVVRASYDRSFPNVLHVTVVPEHPVAVLRRGARAWLVSVRGRVIQPLSAHANPKLPRIWLSASSTVRIGEDLAPAAGGVEARALGLAGPFRSRIAAASFANGSLVFHLRSGLALVLGLPSGIRLKTAVASLAVGSLPAGSTYLDVSVPGRPISGSGSQPTNAQLSGRG